MNARAKMLWTGLVGGAVLLGSHAAWSAVAADVAPSVPGVATPDSNSNPYSVIIDRNVFRLNPPPAPVDPNPTPPPDLPKVHLSGFIQTGDQWKALLAVETKTGNAAAPEAISYSTMSEGDKDGVVELVHMYPGEEKVDINNSGTAMTLTMKENGFSPTAPVAPAGGRAGPNPGIRPLGAPVATPPPSIPGLGGAPQPEIPGENHTLVGGSRFSSGGFNNQNTFAGGTAMNTVMQPQQAIYQGGGVDGRTTGSGVISAGGVPYIPPAAAPLTIPLGQNGNLSHLTQPNSTPVNDTPVNVGMPPVPPIP